MVRRQLNIEDRGRAIAWLQGGNTQRNVAVRLGVSQSVVGRLWQRFQATNSVRNRPRSGRPRSTTNRDDRYITNMALRQRTTTARRLRDNLRTATRFGGGSVMVWGGISIHHRTPLYVVDGNLTGIKEIIRPLVLPGIQQIGGGAVLQDDNARPHRARVVTDFLRQQGIARMDWPAYSPDLAPIEHAWDELGRRVRNNHAPPANLHDMGQLLMAEWQAITQEFFRRLINSMKQRCVECIRARGGFTRY